MSRLQTKSVNHIQQIAVSLALTTTVLAANVLPAFAQGYEGYYANVRQSYYHQEHHKKVMEKNAVKDAAIGGAAGALIGGISHAGILKGALVGAGAGAGVGLIRSSYAGKEHPVEKNVATVGLAGLGLYLATRHGHVL